MGQIPNYLRSGAAAFLAQGLDDLAARITALQLSGGGSTAFTAVDFTDPDTERPAFDVVMWRGPVLPNNAGPTDYYVPA